MKRISTAILVYTENYRFVIVDILNLSKNIKMICIHTELKNKLNKLLPKTHGNPAK